jgi:hypothetical protein
LFWQYFTIKNRYLEKVVFVIWASAVWQCLQSAHQAVCCHLEPHKEEVGEESNTDSQTAEDEDHHSSVKEEVVIPASCLLPPLDLMKKKLKKNPTLTASQMKMRMRMEEATTSLYTDMMNKLLF